MNTTETELVISAAARLLTGKPPPREKFDPHELITLIFHHNLASLASFQAGRLEGWRVRLEGDALKELDATLVQARVRRMMVVRALQDALKIIGDFHPVLFKGLAAAELYPQPHLRDPGDIDLLIHPDHFGVAANYLLENGWELQETVHADRSEDVARLYGFARVFRHPESPVILDLHRAPVDKTEPFWIDPESILDRSIHTVLTDDISVNVPEHEDHLILLALHSVRHGFFSLKWCLDVFFACREWTLEIEQKKFVDNCRKMHVERAVRTGLEVARVFYGPVRNPMDNLLMDGKTQKAITRRNPFIIAKGQLSGQGGLRRFSAMLDLMEGFSSKAYYIAHTLFPPRALFSDSAGELPSRKFYFKNRIEAWQKAVMGK
ncbi:MAG: nucleotidyltransferase family protein [Candidatus Electryonea clarkiae]|nr:nucleotidyltransferase family protein [Candidatus Electryonea clarkiae]